VRSCSVVGAGASAGVSEVFGFVMRDSMRSAQGRNQMGSPDAYPHRGIPRCGGNPALAGAWKLLIAWMAAGVRG